MTSRRPDPLDAIAVAGTSAVPSLPPATHPADTLTAASEAIATPEATALRRAGARAIYGRAGWKPPQITTTLPPIPEESARVASGRLEQTLRTRLFVPKSEVPTEMLIEVLRLMRDRGIVLPPSCMVAALETRDADVRTAIRPVLGERGRWLAALRPGAKWARGRTAAAPQPTASDPTANSTQPTDAAADADDLAKRLDALRETFDLGEREERLAAILKARMIDADTARDWVAATLPNEDAATRGLFLTALTGTLTEADIPLLESVAESDRSSRVKEQARSILMRLPSSAVAKRMQARADELVTVERKRLGKGIRITLEPTETLPPDWKQDGLPGKEAEQRAQSLLGARVWAVLRNVPPSQLGDDIRKNPVAFVEALAEDKYGVDALDALTESAIEAASQGDEVDAAWLGALWEANNGWRSREEPKSGRSMRRLEQIDRLAAVVPGDFMYRWIQAQWRPKKLPSPEVARMLPLIAAPWPEDFAREIHTRLRGLMSDRFTPTTLFKLFGVVGELPSLAAAFPASLLDELLEPWTLPPSDGRSHYEDDVAEEFGKFLRAIELRRTILHAIDEPAATNDTTNETSAGRTSDETTEG